MGQSIEDPILSIESKVRHGKKSFSREFILTWIQDSLFSLQKFIFLDPGFNRQAFGKSHVF